MVNIFTLDMAREYFSTNCKPDNTLLFDNASLLSYYKCFTTGFQTDYLITESVAVGDKFKVDIDAKFIISCGANIQVGNTVSRVLEWYVENGKKVLILENSLPAGTVTVCGLGFIPVEIDYSNRSFSYRDTVHNNLMRFRMTDRTTTASAVTNQSTITIYVTSNLGRDLFATNKITTTADFNLATQQICRSFVSNGSWLWFNCSGFTVSANGSAQSSNGSWVPNYYNQHYQMFGWISKTRCLVSSSFSRGSTSYGGFNSLGFYPYSYLSNPISNSGYNPPYPPLILDAQVNQVVSFAGNGVASSANMLLMTGSYVGMAGSQTSNYNRLAGVTILSPVYIASSFYTSSSGEVIRLAGGMCPCFYTQTPPNSLMTIDKKLFWSGDAQPAFIPTFFSFDDDDWIPNG